MEHSERAHAKLSASGSKRWLACTPSPRIESQFEDSTSSFAEEGTLAHEISENQLKYKLGFINTKTWIERYDYLVGRGELAKHYSPEMDDYVKYYVDTVIERYHEALAKTPDAKISIEERLDFSRWVPEGFGTGDVLIVADDMVEVIDLKYGKGVQVDALNNTQMRLYGLGALEQYSHLYDINQISMTIIQPRLDHISTEALEAEALIGWADEYVRPRALLAYDGEGDQVAGDHCRFCKAKAICSARADANLEMAKYEFKRGELLTIEEIAEILKKSDELKKWAEDISTYALDQAVSHGVKFPDWKLVEGKSNRKYTDEMQVRQALLLEDYAEDDIHKPRELKGITDMTKLLGKKAFETLLSDFIIKPPGRPTLAPEDDKRPELNGVAKAIQDFE